jgi:hypothetical protein
VNANGAPVWKPIQSRISAEPCSSGSSQTGVSWSHKVNATAPASAVSGAGGAASGGRAWTVPGRAMASIRARNTPCAAITGSAKPPSIERLENSINPLRAPW